jgi:hypothetical protein
LFSIYSTIYRRQQQQSATGILTAAVSNRTRQMCNHDDKKGASNEA